MALLQDGWMFRLPVASARHGDFIQAEPRHENAWASGSLTHLIRKVEKTYRIGICHDYQKHLLTYGTGTDTRMYFINQILSRKCLSF